MSAPTLPAQPAASKLAGRLCILLAALMWSTSGLFAKATLFADWPLEQRGVMLAFWRALFAAGVLLPVVRRPRWSPLLVPMTLAFTAMNATYLTSMTQSTAANAIWLQSTAPWWVFVIGVLVLRERIALRELVPLCFGLVGVGLILSFELAQTGSPSRIGVVCGLLAGVFYGCVVVFLRCLRTEDSAWLVALNHLVAALALAPWVMYVGRWPSWAQLAVLVGFGGFQMAIPYVLMTRGLRAVSSQEAVAIGLLEPVLMPVWVYLAWGERPAWWTLGGGALILVGLALRYMVIELLAARHNPKPQ